tara:strand:- start:1 stop:210 length:210 start_codon:yes stop_codon:yes gene_type:complete
MKNKIKVKLAIGHDPKYKKQTNTGVLVGKDVEETVYLTKKDAQSLLQNMCDGMNYEQSRTFVKQYTCLR